MVSVVDSTDMVFWGTEEGLGQLAFKGWEAIERRQREKQEQQWTECSEYC